MIEIFKKEKPDCIIHDSLSPWSKIISQHLKIPAVTLVPSMAINQSVLLKSKINTEVFFEIISKFKRFINIYRQFNDVFNKYGIRPPSIIDIFSSKEDLNIVFTSRSIQIEESSFKSEYKFVGPSIYKRNEQSLEKKLFENKSKKFIFHWGLSITMTLIFIRLVLMYLGNTGDQIFMSIGKDIKKDQT